MRSPYILVKAKDNVISLSQSGAVIVRGKQLATKIAWDFRFLRGSFIAVSPYPSDFRTNRAKRSWTMRR
jgi:hypothetical protein